LKPAASLSLDLDNEWSYLKTRGESSWESLPSYLDVVVPRLLRFFGEREIKSTVFVVGQDAALERNRSALRSIGEAGHEIGNHSFRHEPWLHLYSEGEIEKEIAEAEDAIEEATGQRPRGFRGPGYSLSESTLRVLVRRGYRYDASTLPTFLGPLARAYYFFRSPLRTEDRRQRQALFGTLRDGLRPLRPYAWEVEGKPLVEIPVTTMPLARIPFHASYVLYLAGYSPALAIAYFESAIALCRASNLGPSLLLHPLDFLDGKDVPSLSFFPGMGLPVAKKLELLDRIVRRLRESFDVTGMGQHAERLSAGKLPVVSPASASLPRRAADALA
jgi:peptidoglycan/xylan/chitin deacetylase (PgdA/CDA1 family)